MRIDPPVRAARFVVAAFVVAAALVVGLLAGAAQSRGATGSVTSSNVAVVPGFAPPTYPGYSGVPALPVSDSQLSGYHFSQLAASQVTTAALSAYDTVMLYGIRWSDLSTSAQQAIDTFAETHKVLIWDADDTGAQSYSTFVHPFSTAASGENGHANDAVVSFPGGDNFLASPNSSSPYYLDPQQLVGDRNMINDMNAMTTGTAGWTPALVAANANIPNGGWALAWAYGDVGNHTGLVIYSGIDADAFADPLHPNYSIKELALELSAPFQETPVGSCAPSCQPPPPPPTGGGGSGGGTFASCAFAPPVPSHWVHGNVVIAMKTSAAAGMSGKVVTSTGKVVASARETTQGLLRLRVQTHRLRSNRTTRLKAIVYVNGQQACSRSFRLKVDNVRPRVLRLATTRTGAANLVTVRVSERAWLSIKAHGMKPRKAVLVAARRTVTLHLPARLRGATLVVRDLAGNFVVRHLSWR